MKAPLHPVRRRTFLAATAVSLASAATAPGILLAQAAGKRIGFVDDDLDNFHSRVYLKILREELKARGFTVAGATALQAEKSRTWAKENGLAYFEDVEALGKAVDFFAVLAPSTPATHLGLCERVLPLGKTTFVDKTFAPDRATAEKIFALADRHQVAIQTSSALRYTNVQKHVEKVGRDAVRHVVTWGAGGSFDEYVVHPLELAVSCLGHEVESLMRRGSEPESQLLLGFSGGRTAVVNVYTRTSTPFAAAVTTARGTDILTVDTQKLFVDAAGGMLDFFEAQKPLVDRRETLAILKVIDAAREPAAGQGFVKV
jgi:predicted dehydrogenase